MLLSIINQQQEDKYKLKIPSGKTCGKCDDFKEDDAFSIHGICLLKNTDVYRNQLCTLER